MNAASAPSQKKILCVRIKKYAYDAGYRFVLAVPWHVTGQEITDALAASYESLLRRGRTVLLTTTVRKALDANPDWDWYDEKPAVDVRTDGDTRPARLRQGCNFHPYRQPPYCIDKIQDGKRIVNAAIRPTRDNYGYRFRLTVPEGTALDEIAAHLMATKDAMDAAGMQYYLPTIVKYACQSRPDWIWDEDYPDMDLDLQEILSEKIEEQKES